MKLPLLTLLLLSLVVISGCSTNYNANVTCERFCLGHDMNYYGMYSSDDDYIRCMCSKMIESGVSQ